MLHSSGRTSLRAGTVGVLPGEWEEWDGWDGWDKGENSDKRDRRDERDERGEWEKWEVTVGLWGKSGAI
jgi:hypothetical protein